MTYKDSNWTRGELGNVPDRNPTIECSDEQCDTTTPADDAEGWLLDADPAVPVLCPACRERTPEHRLTPTEARRESNRQLADYAE